MGEITVDGYQSLIEFVVSSEPIPPEWDYLAIYDDTQTEIFRIEVSTDSRFSWIDVDGDPIVSIEGRVSGSDSEITQPETLNYSALFDAASGGRQLTAVEAFAPQTLDQDGDAITVTHTVEIPDQ